MARAKPSNESVKSATSAVVMALLVALVALALALVAPTFVDADADADANEADVRAAVVAALAARQRCPPGNLGDGCSAIICPCTAANTFCNAGLKCEAKATWGQLCSAGKPCANGLSCAPGSQRCYHEPRWVGEPCSAGFNCASGLSCAPGSQLCYHQPRSLGEPCSAGFDCASGLSCAPGSQVCYHSPRLEGEPCSAGFPCRSPDLFCRPGSQKCERARVYGEDCGDNELGDLYPPYCAPGLKCSNKVCMCTTDQGCSSSDVSKLTNSDPLGSFATFSAPLLDRLTVDWTKQLVFGVNPEDNSKPFAKCAVSTGMCGTCVTDADCASMSRNPMDMMMPGRCMHEYLTDIWTSYQANAVAKLDGFTRHCVRSYGFSRGARCLVPSDCVSNQCVSSSALQAGTSTQTVFTTPNAIDEAVCA